MTAGGDVAPIDLPYLFSDYDRHGKRRLYVRLPPKPGERKRRKVRLTAEPGTEEFSRQYWAARNGLVPEKARISTAKPGSFRWIVQHYYASAEFKKLDKRLTQRPRQLVLDKIVDVVGDKAAIIDPAVIRESVRSRGYGAAKEFLAALRAVYRLAIEDGLVGSDPTSGITSPRPKVEGHHTWTRDECEAYEKRWPVGTKPRTVYALGIYAGLRVSDAAVVGRPHLRNGRLRFVQQKNKKRAPVWVDIPVVPPLQEALEGWQGKGLTFVENAYGQPHASGDALSNKFAEWCDAAGLPSRCRFHGLRKACGARLAEAGCSAHEIMAVLGHTTHQQAEVYTRAAARSVMADGGLRRVYGEQIDPPLEHDGPESQKNAG